MRSCHLLLLLMIGFTSSVWSQDSEVVLTRSRNVSMTAEQAWANCIEIVRAAPVIVNTIDSDSQLVAFTMPLGTQDVKNLVLDAPDIDKKQALTLHVTVWISAREKASRVYVRAVPNVGGYFAHSNGQVERQLLDAIEKGGSWMPRGTNSDRKNIADALPEAVRLKALDTLAASPRLKLNTSSLKPSLLTVSLSIRTSDLGSFVSGLGKNYYPGIAHATLWFEPDGSGTAVRIKTLIFESGSLSPVPLESNGKLEAALLDAVKSRLSGSTDAAVSVGSDYRGKPEFWNVLFGLDATPKSDDQPPRLLRELPVPIERAWQSALNVLVQNHVIGRVDRNGGGIEFLSAHSSQAAAAKYFVHSVLVEFTPSGTGVQMSLSIPRPQEPLAEAENELKVLAGQVGTELFIKDRLTWLTTKKESK